jgi:hypothetical protein
MFSNIGLFNLTGHCICLTLQYLDRSLAPGLSRSPTAARRWKAAKSREYQHLQYPVDQPLARNEAFAQCQIWLRRFYHTPVLQ